MREILSQTRPDIVHGHLYHGEITASVISSLAGIPFVTTRHSSGLEFNGSRKWLARAAASRIGAAVAVSRDAAREAVATGIDEKKITVLPSGVDTRRFRMLETDEKSECRRELIGELFPGECPPDAILIGAAGALKEVKNHSLLARIASRLVSSDALPGNRLRFVVAGEGRLRGELEALVSDLGLTGVFSLPGYLHRLDDFFAGLDIFVVTSRSEGVPLAMLEAMSSGVPCVASDVGDIAESLGDTGFTVPLERERDFVEKLSELILDGELRREIGRRARVRVLEHFDMEIWGGRMVSVYEDLIGAKRYS
jgi:glycosyltransferase involved in cell wall biosynthesis